MARRKGQSAAFLKKLRKKYHLGEFKPRKGQKRRKSVKRYGTVVYKDKITPDYEPDRKRRGFLLRAAMAGIAPLPGEKLNIAD